MSTTRINNGTGFLYCSVNSNPDDYSKYYDSSEECLKDIEEDIISDCKTKGYSESETEKVLSHYRIVFSNYSGEWKDTTIMTTYRIRKSYESSPSKNKIEAKGLSLEKAQFELDINERLWKKHGGLVVERSEFQLICEESDDSETITWMIEEVED